MQLKRVHAQYQNFLIEHDKILKDGGEFWNNVYGGYPPEDVVLVARREEIAWVHSEGVHEVVPDARV